MGMFEQFPYSNFHELNLDWIIDQIKNVIESAVISVNGQTGDVILYQSENVVFPNVDSNQWRMVRTASGHTAGVMFNDDYMYVMYDNTADRVYTMNHPPQYPVTSVDGQTGAVRVFPDAGARLPDVTDDYTNIRRQIETNGVQNIVGIEVKQNKAYRMKDTGRYEIYDSDNPPPYPVTSVNGQTGVVMLAIPFTDVTVDDVMFINAVAGHEWGIGRETADGTATIQIVTNSTKAEAYIDFFDEGGQVSYTKKLLTTDDIPSSSGVVSINGQTGVVTIYGDTMPIESGSAYSVKDITDDLNTRLGLVKSDIAIVEDTNNATHNISNGQYVVWKGSLYKATANISSGDGLSGTNLSAVSNGGLNDLNSNITILNNYKNKPDAGYADLDNCTTLKQVMDLVDANDLCCGTGHTGNNSSQNTNFKTLVGATSLSNYDLVYVFKIGYGVYMAVASSEAAISGVKVKFIRRATYSYNDESRMSQTQWMAFNT